MAKYSPVVTHLTINPPVHSLNRAERTGNLCERTRFIIYKGGREYASLRILLGLDWLTSATSLS